MTTLSPLAQAANVLRATLPIQFKGRRVYVRNKTPRIEIYGQDATAEVADWLRQQGWFVQGNTTSYTITKPDRFKTRDGYTLYRLNGRWVDNLKPADVDMTFPADPENKLPVDDYGRPLDGEYEEGLHG